MQIKGSNVTLMVSDLDRAISFYCGLLGFKLSNRDGDHWADLEGPGITLALHPTDKEVRRGNNVQIGMGVDDFEETLGELDAQSIRYQLQTEGMLRMAFISDPDGNAMYFVEMEEGLM